MHELMSVVGFVLVCVAVAMLVVGYVIWRRRRTVSPLGYLRRQLSNRAEQAEILGYLKAAELPDDPAKAEIVLELARLTVEQFYPSAIMYSLVLMIFGEYLIKPAFYLLPLGLLYLLLNIWSHHSRRRMKAVASRLLASAKG